jgi:hypothetical protein
MSKPVSPLHAATWTVGLAGAVFLGWLWLAPSAPETASGSPATVAAPPISSAVPTASARPAPSLDPATEALLTALARTIARGEARPDEAVLTIKDEAALHRFLQRAQQAGLTIIARVDALRSVRVRFPSLEALRGELQQNAADYSGLTANNLVGIPQPPAKQDRPDVPPVPFRNDTLAFIGATGDRSSWGRGTTIAILDTGIAADPTFGAGRVRTWDIGLGSAPGAGSDDGHGTAVSALAAGAAPDAGGVAPGASLLGIRVTDAAGVSDLFTISQAIVAAVDAGANLINISLGGYATGPVLDAAIDYATRKGALIIAAAGNDQAAQLTWPAADPRVVSVGAIDQAEQQVAFSNSGEQLQLAAPGYGVQTAWLDGRRVYVDGTSASAPLVTGAIAALLSQFPALTARQAADLLTRTANDGGAPGPDPAYGRGIINLATAMNRANSTYVDTAVSSHSYDPATGRMQVVVQNRSGRTVTGLALDVSAGPTTTRQAVPGLAAGETYVASVPVSESTLKSAGSLTFTSQLVNPVGTVDAVPANNQRASVLSATPPKK